MDIKNLEQLFTLMIAHDPAILDRHGQWSADLPTFGGLGPRDTTEVWSWDATRLIVGSCADELRIVSRDDWPRA